MDGKSAESGEDRLIMLQCQNRRRNENDDLLAVFNGFHSGTERDLGLAVADVTAQKTVHRCRLLHIRLDLLDRRYLRIGLLIREYRFECSLHIVVSGKCIARLAQTCGVKGNELLCHALCGSLDTCFRFAPFGAAHLGQLDRTVICGFGLGIVFVNGTSTGGSDILVRLLKLKYRNVPIGQISICFDAVVVILTGLVFQDLNKALYTGITVFICGKMVDAVVYRFDYSKVALIISKEYEAIAQAIGQQLDRGATFLHGEGSYTHKNTKVVLAAVKKQQLTELKELVMQIDPDAFVIVQEAHQVLGDGFSRYSKDGL